ncbi:DUF58 domain-containing protein [Salinibacillus xinjiangensis]|uniref:DUF58 domain-containing protein n=2 Tax=Salinibacillus xinjiangensis TaxID=1229268 RepID=A0A6G1X9C9_9BACI|nr:DUF58 domain-containing protein [Salinibacillus xinjiangensis]
MVAAILGVSWLVIIAFNLLVIFGSFVDFIFLPKRDQLYVKRSIPNEMERGLSYNVQVELGNASAHGLRARIIDGLPQSFEQSFPLNVTIPYGEKMTLTYETKALFRGDYNVSKIYVRVRSAIGLWEKQLTFEREESIQVIPDLTEAKLYLESAQAFLLYEGEKIRKQRSGVGEFAKIRNYVVGDDPRKINWRQTAKLQEVMTNEYEPEHGKYITLLIDCGRLMGAELLTGNRLEKALEASLTVAASALQKGDYVAVLAFSKDVKVYVPPAKGMSHLQTIIRSLYGIKVDEAESNYAAVFQYVQTMQKKRSLLFLFSDVQTFLYEESALAHLNRLSKRHLFLMIGIEDETIIKRKNEEPSHVKSAMIKSMAYQHLAKKTRKQLKWQSQGLHIVEAKEENLATAAVSQYIDIMNRNLL